MKKFVCLLTVALLMLTMASSALAATGSASYKDGVITYSIKDIDGTCEVYLNGSKLIGAATSEGTKTYSTTLTGDSNYLEYADNSGSKNIPIKMPEAPATEEPTATPEPTAEPTAEPTVEPTAEPTPTPVITEAPKTEAPKTEAPATEAPKTTAPTKAPSTDNDDVPKTGDATTTFVFVIVAAMLLAAGALTAMRVYARKK